jgi:hypothetical protein
MKFRHFWDVAPCSRVEVDRRFRGASASIIRAVMEAVRTSETSVNFNMTTWRYIPEDSKLPISILFYIGTYSCIVLLLHFFLLHENEGTQKKIKISTCFTHIRSILF